MNLRFFRGLVPVAGTLLAGALLWGVYDRLQALETVNQALRERLSSLRSGSPTDVLIRRTELLSEGIRLDGTALRLSDERGDTVRLRDVLPDGGVVFRFSRLQCGLCVEAQTRLFSPCFRPGVCRRRICRNPAFCVWTGICACAAFTYPAGIDPRKRRLFSRRCAGKENEKAETVFSFWIFREEIVN